MKKLFSFLLIICSIILVIACKQEPEPEPVVLSYIEITNQAFKTEYFVGEELDTTGLEITAYYSDGSSEIVEDWTVVYDFSEPGEEIEVNVLYDGKQISFTVSVKNCEQLIDLSNEDVGMVFSLKNGEYYSDFNLTPYITSELKDESVLSINFKAKSIRAVNHVKGKLISKSVDGNEKTISNKVEFIDKIPCDKDFLVNKVFSLNEEIKANIYLRLSFNKNDSTDESILLKYDNDFIIFENGKGLSSESEYFSAELNEKGIVVKINPYYEIENDWKCKIYSLNFPVAIRPSPDEVDQKNLHIKELEYEFQFLEVNRENYIVWEAPVRKGDGEFTPICDAIKIIPATGINFYDVFDYETAVSPELKIHYDCNEKEVTIGDNNVNFTLEELCDSSMFDEFWVYFNLYLGSESDENYIFYGQNLTSGCYSMSQMNEFVFSSNNNGLIWDYEIGEYDFQTSDYVDAMKNENVYIQDMSDKLVINKYNNKCFVLMEYVLRLKNSSTVYKPYEKKYYSEFPNNKNEINLSKYDFYSYPIDCKSLLPATLNSKYVYFGVFPRSVLPLNSTVKIDESKTIKMGANIYYEGSDGEYYIKVKENPYEGFIEYGEYSDHSKALEGNFRYFKIEPIKWQVVTTDYDYNEGKTAALLVATNILDANIAYSDSYTIRSIEDDTLIYPNNYKYSQIRAYLNGTDYFDDTNERNNKYSNNGFLQTAFTPSAQSRINITNVKNDFTHICPSYYREEKYYFEGDVNDKIFLLSPREDFYPGRKSTDYALANNNSSWNFWYRGPHAKTFELMTEDWMGIVPALTISLE